MKKRVLVLGGSGMLGSMVADYLSRDSELYVAATARNASFAASCRERFSGIDWRELDAVANIPDAPAVLDGFDWVVNCIGIIKPLIHDDNAYEVDRAIRVNALFPHLLANWTASRGERVLQVATDCVYSGSKGRYAESDPHDPLDVYGKTKSLGEVYSPNVHHFRCSIIGPEAGQPKSLLEWFLSQPRGASVNGFTNHQWNGMTTLQFAKLCGGVIKRDLALPPLQHVIPTGTVSKCDMLNRFAEHFRRGDVTVTPTQASVVIDRTLTTNSAELNYRLWDAAGYRQPPTIPEMIAELAMESEPFAG